MKFATIAIARLPVVSMASLVGPWLDLVIRGRLDCRREDSTHVA
jgi:hypothetical protein